MLSFLRSEEKEVSENKHHLSKDFAVHVRFNLMSSDVRHTQWHLRERSYGTITRSVRLPETANHEETGVW